MKPLPAVIVAAGSSSRLGQPKQLLLVNGEPLLQRAVRIAREAGASPVFVVLGAHREVIEATIDFTWARIVNNEHWPDGIATSICAGVRALEKEVSDCSGALLMLCDQPSVTAEHLRKMIHEFAQSDESEVASVYAAKRGIPAIFPHQAFSDLLALRGDKGARGLLTDPGRRVIEVPLAGGEIDIDRPEDLTHLR
jgi:molybdenum cofactor cytidylyltransferase